MLRGDKKSAWAAGLVLLGAQLLVIGGLTHGLYAPFFLPAKPEQPTSTRRAVLDAPMQLGIDGRIGFAEERYASQRIHVQVRFDAPGLIEVVFRQTEPLEARFHSFLLSAEPELKSGFAEASSVEFDLANRDDGFLCPLGRPVTLEIVADGPRLSATVDGTLIARAWDSRVVVGGTAAQGVRGSAELLAFEVEPLPWPEHAGRERDLLLLLALTAVGLLALALLGAEIIHRGTGVARREAMLCESLALLPLSVYALLLTRQRAPHLFEFLGAVLLFFIIQAICLLRGTGRRRIGPFLAGMTHACLIAVLMGVLISPRLLQPDVERANVLTHYHWSGARMPRALLWYLHPLCRRWNEYLANRTFRSRAVQLEKPSDVVRIFCLGTSSTYGHGFRAEQQADYPAQLGELLRHAGGGRKVEVINAAVAGSTGVRLLPFFREVLCRYQPDVLVLSLAFNDAAALTQVDEQSYYQRITSSDYSNTFLLGLRERFSMRWRQQRYVTNRDLFAQGREREIKRGQGERNAPRLFAAMLSEYWRECRARGIRLLLIQEPVRAPVYLVRELHHAMAQFASDQGVPLLDPQPALETAGGKERFQDEVHPDRLGHQVIATQLAQMLLEQKIL